ncbi:MAG: class I SAM-dependent methyltransferase [Candidatus Limnocylindrales bacterium]
MIRSDWTGAPATAAEDARFASYYDLQYGFGPDDSPWPDVDWFRSVASGTGGPVLELGCGTGRIAAALAADGHLVVGLDRSEAMLARAAERARAAGVGVELVRGDLVELDLGRRFPLVIVPFNTFLMVPPDNRRSCLAKIRGHLAPEGVLAIDVFQPDPERIAGFDGGVLDEGSALDPRSGERVTFFTSTRATVDRTVHTLRVDAVGDDGIVHRHERVLTLYFLYRREVELLLEGAGFELLSVHGDGEGTPADERSPRLLVLARRRERDERSDRRR